MPKKQTYKEIHGTTRVGDFLRSIGKTDLLNKVVSTGFNLATGDVKGAISSLLHSSDELSQEQRDFALKLLESDVKENEEISKRWSYDMVSDSWLSKNVRPLVLLYLIVSMSIMAILDSSLDSFVVGIEWITLLKSLLTIVIIAYFGGRSYEKSKKL